MAFIGDTVITYTAPDTEVEGKITIIFHSEDVFYVIGYKAGSELSYVVRRKGQFRVTFAGAYGSQEV